MPVWAADIFGGRHRDHTSARRRHAGQFRARRGSARVHRSRRGRRGRLVKGSPAAKAWGRRMRHMRKR